MMTEVSDQSAHQGKVCGHLLVTVTATLWTAELSEKVKRMACETDMACVLLLLTAFTKCSATPVGMNTVESIQGHAQAQCCCATGVVPTFESRRAKLDPESSLPKRRQVRKMHKVLHKVFKLTLSPSTGLTAPAQSRSGGCDAKHNQHIPHNIIFALHTTLQAPSCVRVINRR